MASITIRNLEKELKARLRIQAAVHGRSMEEEARNILKSALSEEASQTSNLAETIQKRFAKFGGVELPELKRESIRAPIDFDK